MPAMIAGHGMNVRFYYFIRRALRRDGPAGGVHPA